MKTELDIERDITVKNVQDAKPEQAIKGFKLEPTIFLTQKGKEEVRKTLRRNNEQILCLTDGTFALEVEDEMEGMCEYFHSDDINDLV